MINEDPKDNLRLELLHLARSTLCTITFGRDTDQVRLRNSGWLSYEEAIEILRLRNSPKKETDEDPRIVKALEVAFTYGGIEGDHHRMWVIDQMVRALMGDGYEEWVEKYEEPDEEYGYAEWDVGIAP